MVMINRPVFCSLSMTSWTKFKLKIKIRILQCLLGLLFAVSESKSGPPSPSSCKITLWLTPPPHLNKPRSILFFGFSQIHFILQCFCRVIPDLLSVIDRYCFYDIQVWGMVRQGAIGYNNLNMSLESAKSEEPKQTRRYPCQI